MNRSKSFLLASTLLAAALSVSAVHAQAQVLARSSQTAQTVNRPLRVTVGAEALGGFDTAELPRTLTGYDLSGVVRIVRVTSPRAVQVNLERANLVLRFGVNSRLWGQFARPPRDAQFDLAISSASAQSSTEPVPVQVVVENLQNRAQTTLEVMARLP
jgi:hypothetical protein